MKTQFNATLKVSREQLCHMLGVSDKTGRKEYRLILDSLAIVNRNYLMYGDLQRYGILELNAVK